MFDRWRWTASSLPYLASQSDRLIPPRMLPLLAIGIWPGALCDTTESALTAVGKPGYAASGSLLKVLFTAAGIPWGFFLAGTLGAVVVVALNDIPLYGRITYGLWREG